MATTPRATTTVSATAGVLSAGTELCCVVGPVATLPDATPRLFGSAAAIHATHGYSEALEYSAAHISKTGKPVLFLGLPITVAGVIGRVDKSGNSDTSVASVVAGVDGVLTEHDGAVRVVRGGTVGTDQILLEVSLDGEVTWKPVKLGTASSYVIPYVNVTLSFAAGDLTAGDTVITWHGSGPFADEDEFAVARANLAAQLKLFRSGIVIGDMPDGATAQGYLDEIAAYRTENERFTRFRASIPDRLPQAALSHDVARMTGAPALTFAEVGATGDTITRAAGSWITDGFHVGDFVTVANSVSNNVTGKIAALTATVLTFGTTDLVNEGPVSGCTVVGYPGLTFAEVGATGDTITRNRGSWVDDGFREGDLVTIAGTASNNVTTDAIAGVTPLVLTLGSTDLAAEEIGTNPVTITAGQTKAVWIAEQEAAFEDVRGGDDGFRLDLSAGRARMSSPFSGWKFRRPASWFDSIRTFQHDLHVAAWRKSFGDVDADLFDSDGNLVEYDDRVDGGAASAAGFTSLRTWGNGPRGGFIALSLTRAEDGSILSQSAKADVVNLACTVVQLNTETAAIGVDLVLNDDGTATRDSLSTIESAVNAALEVALLKNVKGEGQRASKAVWSADPSTVFNVAEPELIGTLDLNLNGTVHSVRTTARVRSGGQA